MCIITLRESEQEEEDEETAIKDQTLFIELKRTKSKTCGLRFCLSALIINYHRR